MIASSVLLAMYSPLLIGWPLPDAGEELVVLGLVHLVLRAVVDATSRPAIDPQALAAVPRSSARPFVPSTWALMSFLQPGCCRQLLNSLAPSAYS